MSSVIGGVLGVLAILVSVCLHEAGHLGVAKALGMNVTRYFVGFGPTIWSIRFAGTEYGVKAVPLGGFVKIVGMNAGDEDGADSRAMWRFPLWKRTAVMAAGSMVQFLIGFVIFWGLAANVAMPNAANRGPFVQGDEVMAQRPFVSVAEGGPAETAGLREGDRIVRLGDEAIATYGDLVSAVRSMPTGTDVEVEYVRAGAVRHTVITALTALRPPVDDPGGPPVAVPVVGLGLSFDPALPRRVEYNAAEAVPVAASWFGQICARTAESIGELPVRVVGLVKAMGGDTRDPQSPVSIVAFSRGSGRLFATGDYSSLLGTIGSINIFVGLFNLLPLPPLDGGHIATAWLARLRGRRPQPTSRRWLVLLTYTTVALLAALALLTVVADVVNPTLR